MARFLDVIDVSMPLTGAFEYLADFCHCADWDPGVIEARRVDSGPLGVGSRFALVVAFLGRRVPMQYTLEAHEPPHRILLRGTASGVESIDEITLVPRSDGTRITYDARVELAGVARLADPLLGLVFQRIGAAAARGLRERMEALATGSRSAPRSLGRDKRAGAGS